MLVLLVGSLLARVQTHGNGKNLCRPSPETKGKLRPANSRVQEPQS